MTPSFLSTIDFFVYFTHPNCRESFGRHDNALVRLIDISFQCD